MAREGLGIVGAVVGSYFGPIGTQIGYAIGSAVGGYIDPIKIPGPSLGEAPIQTSRDGVPIPIAWGICHVHGNVIIKNPEYQVTTWKRQGKGGSTKVSETRRYRTFGVGVCTSSIGSVAAILRIWENDRLVYDVRSSPSIPAAETTKYAEGIRIYTGEESQLPDPDLEAHWGVGDTPAFRGLAYVVWVGKDLTDFGGAIPQFRFEVNTHPEMVGTSHVYALEFTDALDNAPVPTKGAVLQMPIDGLTNTSIPLNGLLGSVLVTYEMEDEGLTNAPLPLDGLLGTTLVEYTCPPEGLTNTAEPDNGLLGTLLVTYICPDEGLTNTATPQDGTLT